MFAENRRAVYNHGKCLFLKTHQKSDVSTYLHTSILTGKHEFVYCKWFKADLHEPPLVTPRGVSDK